MKTVSIPEEILFTDLTDAGLSDGLEREYVFCQTRKFRADFAYPAEKLLIEVEGGTRGGKSRHTNGDGYEKDCFKYNLAQLLGFRVLRFTTNMVASREAIKTILEARGYDE
jgi:very-short-patch-repair endonuclease